MVNNAELSDWQLEFSKAYQADAYDRNRGIRNIQGYTAYNYGHYADSEQSELKRSGRSPQIYNFIQMIIRGLAGNMVMNWFDPQFVPREGEDMAPYEAAQRLWYACKEHYNYKKSALEVIENGLSYRGVEELVIDKPTANPRTWGLKFESLRPDMVIFDPNNTSDRISRNSQQVWKVFYLTLEQALGVWKDKKKELQDRIKLELLDKPEEELNSLLGDFENFDMDTFAELEQKRRFGNTYQFVQKYELKNEDITRQILKDSAVEVPQTEFKLGSQEDVAIKQNWALQHGYIISDDNLLTFDETQRIMHTKVWSEELGMIMENKKDARQVGHIPVYAWSYLEKWGKSIGVTDILWDTQDDFNRREMQKTKILEETNINGKPYLHGMLTNGDMDKLNEIATDWNDASKPIDIPEDVPPQLVQSLMGIVPGTQLNPAIFQDESKKVEIMQQIGSLPPALQGFTERTGESGIHYGRKVIEGTVMNRLPMESYIQYENDKATDWIRLVPKIYGGAHNYDREVANRNDKIVLNEFVGIDEQGADLVENDISKVHRARVIITQTEENDYLKQANREMYINGLQAMQPTPYNQALVAALQGKFATSMDYTDDAEKEQMEKLRDQSVELAEMSNLVKLKQLETQLSQLGGEPQGGETMKKRGRPREKPPVGKPEEEGVEPVREPVRQTKSAIEGREKASEAVGQNDMEKRKESAETV